MKHRAESIQPFRAFGERIFAALDGVANDITSAVRRLLSTPLFVSAIVLTFACGIGVNAAVFSIVAAVILKPLPFAEGSQLVQILSANPEGRMVPGASFGQIKSLGARRDIFRAIAIVNGAHDLTAMAAGHSLAVSGLFITPEYMSVLAIKPRNPLNNAVVKGPYAGNFVIISYDFWRYAFKGDPRVVGKSIRIGRDSFTVAGVLPDGQHLLEAQSASIGTRDVLLPFPRIVLSSEWANTVWGAVGLLNSGIKPVTSAQANAALPPSQRITVRSLQEAALGPIRPTLLLVVVAGIAILLLACSNVANLLAARWSYREQEFAVRRALGATGTQLSMQLLAEASLLALAGGAIGIACAYALLQALRADLVPLLPPETAIPLDASTLLYGVAFVVIAALVSAIFPILSLRSHDLRSVLNAGGRGGNIRRRTRLSSGLVIAEVALALALVATATLVVRGFINLITTPLGVRTSGVVLTDPIVLPGSYHTETAHAILERRLLQQLYALPGVRSAALSLVYPQSGTQMFSGAEIYGQSASGPRYPVCAFNSVTEQYFSSLGIAVLAGRPFRNSDTWTSEPVALVNTKFVETFIRGRSPIGAKLRIDTGPPGKAWARIVGVVGGERVSNIIPDRPIFYVPLSQTNPTLANVQLAEIYAPDRDPGKMGSEIQRVFAQTLSQNAAPDTFTFAERVASDAITARALSLLITLLAFVALVLAVSGVFSVVAFSVSRRTHEFGIRITLGATSASIINDVLRRALRTAVAGCLAGLAIAVAMSSTLQRTLQNVSALDPITAMLVVALVCAAILAASVLPALRAANVQPIESLRYE